MNSLKTVIVVGVLAIVGYGLYQGLNNGFQFEPPPMPDGWENEQPGGSAIPSIDPGTQQTIASTPGTAPQAGVMPTPADASLNPPYAGSTTSMPTNGDSLPPTSLPAGPGGEANGAPNTGHATGLSNASSFGPGAGTLSPAATGQPAADSSQAGAQPDPSGQSPLVDAGQTPSSTGDRYPDFQAGDRGSSPAESASPAQTSPAASETNAAFSVAMSTAKEQLNRGRMDQALMTLSLWHEKAGLSGPDQQQLTSLLDQVAGTVIYSRKHLLEAAYQVRPGDRLDDIARNYKVPPGLLVKINGIRDPDNLTPGQELKVVRGPFNAQINTTGGVLTLFLGGYYGGRFKVHTGPEFDGIVGSFVVTGKNRSHTSFGGQPWIELGQGYAAGGSTPGAPSISIVGMDVPSQAASGLHQGQIGVSVQDADDLFDILSQGSKVTIVR